MLAAALEVGCTPRGRLPQDWDQSLRTAISEYDRIDPGCPKEVEDLRDSYGVAVHSWHDLVWRVLAATQPDAFDPSPRTVDPLDWRYGQGYSAGPERDAAVENAVRDRAKVYATACRLLSDPTMWTQVGGADGPAGRDGEGGPAAAAEGSSGAGSEAAATGAVSLHPVARTILELLSGCQKLSRVEIANEMKQAVRDDSRHPGWYVIDDKSINKYLSQLAECGFAIVPKRGRVSITNRGMSYLEALPPRT